MAKSAKAREPSIFYAYKLDPFMKIRGLVVLLLILSLLVPPPLWASPDTLRGTAIKEQTGKGAGLEELEAELKNGQGSISPITRAIPPTVALPTSKNFWTGRRNGSILFPTAATRPAAGLEEQRDASYPEWPDSVAGVGGQVGMSGLGDEMQTSAGLEENPFSKELNLVVDRVAMLPVKHGSLEVLERQSAYSKVMCRLVLGRLYKQDFGDPHLISIPVQKLPLDLIDWLRKVEVMPLSGNRMTVADYLARYVDEVVFAPYLLHLSDDGVINQQGGMVEHALSSARGLPASIRGNSIRADRRVIYVAVGRLIKPDGNSVKHLSELKTARMISVGALDFVQHIIEEIAHLETMQLILEGRLHPKYYDKPEFLWFEKIAKTIRLGAVNGSLRQVMKESYPLQVRTGEVDRFIDDYIQELKESLTHLNKRLSLPGINFGYDYITNQPVAGGLEEKDYYDVLGVSRKATEKEIRRAYRKRASLVHPDVVGEDKKKEAEDKFKKLNEAYRVLSDPGKRAQYDQEFFGESGPNRPQGRAQYYGRRVSREPTSNHPATVSPRTRGSAYLVMRRCVQRAFELTKQDMPDAQRRETVILDPLIPSVRPRDLMLVWPAPHLRDDRLFYGYGLESYFDDEVPAEVWGRVDPAPTRLWIRLMALEHQPPYHTEHNLDSYVELAKIEIPGPALPEPGSGMSLAPYVEQIRSAINQLLSEVHLSQSSARGIEQPHPVAGGLSANRSGGEESAGLEEAADLLRIFVSVDYDLEGRLRRVESSLPRLDVVEKRNFFYGLALLAEEEQVSDFILDVFMQKNKLTQRVRDSLLRIVERDSTGETAAGLYLLLVSSKGGPQDMREIFTALSQERRWGELFRKSALPLEVIIDAQIQEEGTRLLLLPSSSEGGSDPESYGRVGNLQAERAGLLTGGQETLFGKHSVYLDAFFSASNASMAGYSSSLEGETRIDLPEQILRRRQQAAMAINLNTQMARWLIWEGLETSHERPMTSLWLLKKAIELEETYLKWLELAGEDEASPGQQESVDALYGQMKDFKDSWLRKLGLRAAGGLEERVESLTEEVFNQPGVYERLKELLGTIWIENPEENRDPDKVLRPIEYRDPRISFVVQDSKDLNRIVGFVTAYPSTKTAGAVFVPWIAVDESMRGRGIGRVLMQSVFAAAANIQGIESVDWWIDKEDEGNLGFYQSLGAAAVIGADGKTVEADGGRRMRYRKTLNTQISAGARPGEEPTGRAGGLEEKGEEPIPAVPGTKNAPYSGGLEERGLVRVQTQWAIPEGSLQSLIKGTTERQGRIPDEYGKYTVSGSGVIFHESPSHYYVLSAAHVTNPTSLPRDTFDPKVQVTLSDGTQVRGQVVVESYEHVPDLSVVRIPKDRVSPAAVAVIPLGTPRLIKQAMATEEEATILGYPEQPPWQRRTSMVVSQGIGSSSWTNYFKEEYLGVDGTVPGGFSGGPVIYRDHLIGIVSGGGNRSTTSQSVGSIGQVLRETRDSVLPNKGFDNFADEDDRRAFATALARQESLGEKEAPTAGLEEAVVEMIEKIPGVLALDDKGAPPYYLSPNALSFPVEGKEVDLPGEVYQMLRGSTLHGEEPKGFALMTRGKLEVTGGSLFIDGGLISPELTSRLQTDFGRSGIPIKVIRIGPGEFEKELKEAQERMSEGKQVAVWLEPATDPEAILKAYDKNKPFPPTALLDKKSLWTGSPERLFMLLQDALFKGRILYLQAVPIIEQRVKEEGVSLVTFRYA